ncbi:hypothetical protein IEQ34_001997 [Dendrobium chrysotoxum]|uniref:Uncharacterized protein n=1 Tax=Dendrobium chrysotoxum TaxID=161865 RepID=A0AAV7H3R2_DENCH|nr:hypothetical protein IEQ34_001997 [Dendrobium chrysotoxum]
MWLLFHFSVWAFRVPMLAGFPWFPALISYVCLLDSSPGWASRGCWLGSRGCLAVFPVLLLGLLPWLGDPWLVLWVPMLAGFPWFPALVSCVCLLDSSPGWASRGCWLGSRGCLAVFPVLLLGLLPWLGDPWLVLWVPMLAGFPWFPALVSCVCLLDSSPGWASRGCWLGSRGCLAVFPVLLLGLLPWLGDPWLVLWMSYQRPVTSRCYVTTFRKICDAFVEIIDDEVEQTFRNLKIHQFLKFPAFQQCIPLLFEILKFWNAADEGFVVNGHLLKFTSDEVSLLTGLPNRGDEIKWKVDPLTGPLSTDIKTEITKFDRLSVNATKIKTFIMYLLSMSYQRPVTSRCYVTTFRKICDAFVEIIDDEVEQTFRNLKIHQFLKFPAFQQCIPLLFEILKFWNAADEGFVVNGHLLKFTSDEVSLLTGLPNRGDEIKWKVDPLTGPLSTDIKTEITKFDRLSVNATKIKTFIMFLNFMVNEFNTITDKFAMEKPLGYINSFFPLLLIWFLEHFSYNKPSNPESRPRFLRWEGNTEMYYTQESATKLFKFLKNNKIYLVLQDVTNEEAEGLGADLNAIQNLESRPHLHPSKFASPKSKKIHTSPPPSPHSPHVEPPQSSPQPPIQPSSLPPTKQPLPTEWSTVQNKLMEALQNLCNRIEDNLGRRIDRLEDNLEKLEATVDSL